jgi:hypothetical protein
MTMELEKPSNKGKRKNTKDWCKGKRENYIL